MKGEFLDFRLKTEFISECEPLLFITNSNPRRKGFKFIFFLSYPLTNLF